MQRFAHPASSILSVFVLCLCWTVLAPAPTRAQGSHYGDPEALEREIEKIESDGDSAAQVPEGPVLREGDDGEAVAPVIARLQAGGYLPSDFEGQTYTSEVASAVESFQADRGITGDGLVGPETRRAMNQGPAQRLGEIRQSLERQKAFFSERQDRYVLVNIPDAQLIYFEDGRPAMEMKVIVGQEGWGTPTMDETIEHIVVNPDWDVPASIVAADIAPEVAQNPGYLDENNLVVLDGWGPDAPRVDPSRIAWGSVTEDNWSYHLRQLPGDDNPLGQVKISFPNDDAIYLHGTPAQEAFDKNERAVSHGCIRMERPLDLAGRLLEVGTEDWDTERLRQTVGSNEQQKVELDTTVPVHLVYWTAFVDSSGELRLVPDVYDQMAEMAEMDETGG